MKGETKPRLDYSLLALGVVVLAGIVYLVAGRPALMLPVLMLLGAVFFFALAFEELRRGKVLTIASGPTTRERTPVLYWVSVASRIIIAVVILVVLAIQSAS